MRLSCASKCLELLQKQRTRLARSKTNVKVFIKEYCPCKCGTSVADLSFCVVSFGSVFIFCVFR